MRIACISTSRVPSRTANSIQLMKVCQSLVDLGHQVQLWIPEVAESGWPAAANRNTGPSAPDETQGDTDGRARRTPGVTPTATRATQGAEVQFPDPARSQVALDDQLAQHYGVRGGFGLRRIASWPALRGYDFCWRAVRSAQRSGAELLYLWPYQAAAFASLLGIPTLLELHDRPSGAMGPLLFRLFLLGGGKRRVLYTTEGLRDSLPGWGRDRLQPPFGVRAPNGVELERFANLPEPAESRRALGLPDGITVGYAGQLYAGRGLELLFELARRVPELRFMWIGGEPEAVEHWRRRASAEAVINLDIRGFVPNAELPKWLGACDVLAMPYQRRISVSSGGDTAASASPMKAFEYLAAGRAILSSDLPVLREVLTERNAILLEPEDVQAWEQALRSLSQDAPRRRALSEQARADAAQHSWVKRTEQALSGIEL